MSLKYEPASVPLHLRVEEGDVELAAKRAGLCRAVAASLRQNHHLEALQSGVRNEVMAKSAAWEGTVEW